MTHILKENQSGTYTINHILPPRHPVPTNRPPIPKVPPRRHKQPQPKTAEPPRANPQRRSALPTHYEIRARPYPSPTTHRILHVRCVLVHQLLVAGVMRARLDFEDVVAIVLGAREDHGDPFALEQRVVQDTVLPGFLDGDAGTVAHHGRCGRFEGAEECVGGTTVPVLRHGCVEDLQAEYR